MEQGKANRTRFRRPYGPPPAVVGHPTLCTISLSHSLTAFLTAFARFRFCSWWRATASLSRSPRFFCSSSIFLCVNTGSPNVHREHFI